MLSVNIIRQQEQLTKKIINETDKVYFICSIDRETSIFFLHYGTYVTSQLKATLYIELSCNFCFIEKYKIFNMIS